jgi:hypothetical protein
MITTYDVVQDWIQPGNLDGRWGRDLGGPPRQAERAGLGSGRATTRDYVLDWKPRARPVVRALASTEGTPNFWVEAVFLSVRVSPADRGASRSFVDFAPVSDTGRLPATRRFICVRILLVQQMDSTEEQRGIEFDIVTTPDIPKSFSSLTPQQKALIASFRVRAQVLKDELNPGGTEILADTAEVLSVAERTVLALISDVEISPLDERVGGGSDFDITTVKPPRKLRLPRIAGRIQLMPQGDQEMREEESMTIAEVLTRVVADMDHVPIETVTPEYIKARKAEIETRMQQNKNDPR